MGKKIPVNDRLAPRLLVAFFVGLTLLLGGFVWLAVAGHTGVVTDDAYQKGLRYNTTLQQAAATAGWQSDVTLDFPQPRAAALTFRLRDAEGKAVTQAHVHAYFVRPTQAGHDRDVAMVFSQDVYKGAVELPLAGLWQVTVAATVDGLTYQAGRRITVP